MNKPKIAQRPKNVLIRNLTAEDNDVIDQVKRITCTGTGTKAILFGLRKLLELQDRLDEQAADLKELRTLTRNVIMANKAVAEIEFQANMVDELRTKAMRKLTNVFTEKHFHDLGRGEAKGCSSHYYMADEGCPDCLAVIIDQDENIREVDDDEETPEEERIYS